MSAILDLATLVKDYHALRPLRIERLTLVRGDQVAILGLDQTAAEVLINLITGAVLPDRGEVRAFGQPTAEIADATAWLTAADRFGIVSHRAVLLEGLTATQNLAMPFSLDIEPPAPEVVRQAHALGDEAGVDPADWEGRVADLDPLTRARIHLARALAFAPDILLVDHLSAGVPRSDVPALAGQIRRVCVARGIACLTLTADDEFADVVAPRVLTLEPATGVLREARRGWFSRRIRG